MGAVKMKSIAVTKPDMAVMQRDKMGLSPFGLLSMAFHDAVSQRSTWNTGFYREVPLELLEEQAEDATASAVPEIHFDIDLQVILQQLQNKEKKDTPEGRILDRIRQLEQSLGRMQAENHVLSVKAKQGAEKPPQAGSHTAISFKTAGKTAKGVGTGAMLTGIQMRMQHSQFMQAGNLPQKASGSQVQMLEALLQAGNLPQKASGNQVQMLEALLQAGNLPQRVSGNQRQVLEALLQAGNLPQKASGNQSQVLQALLQTGNPQQMRNMALPKTSAMRMTMNPGQINQSPTMMQTLWVLHHLQNAALPHTQTVSPLQHKVAAVHPQMLLSALEGHGLSEGTLSYLETENIAGKQDFPMQKSSVSAMQKQNIIDSADIIKQVNQIFSGMQKPGIGKLQTSLTIQKKDIITAPIDAVIKPHLLQSQPIKQKIQPLKPVAANTSVPAGNGWTPYWQAEHPGFDRGKPIGKVPEGKANYSILLPDILRQRQAMFDTSGTAEGASGTEFSYSQQAEGISLQDKFARRMTEKIAHAARLAASRQLMLAQEKQPEKLQNDKITAQKPHQESELLGQNSSEVCLGQESASPFAQTGAQELSQPAEMILLQQIEQQSGSDMVQKSSDSLKTDIAQKSSDSRKTHKAQNASDVHETHTIQKNADSSQTDTAQNTSGVPETHIMQKTADSSQTDDTAPLIDGTSDEMRLAQKPASSFVQAVPQELTQPAEMVLLQQKEGQFETHMVQESGDSLKTHTAQKSSDSLKMHMAQKSSDSSKTHKAQKSSSLPITHTAQNANGAPETHTMQRPADLSQTNDTAFPIDNASDEMRLAQKPVSPFAQAMPQELAQSAEMVLLQQKEGQPETHTAQESNDSPEMDIAQKSSDSPKTHKAQNASSLSKTHTAQSFDGSSETDIARKSGDSSETRIAQSSNGAHETHTMQKTADSSQTDDTASSINNISDELRLAQKPVSPLAQTVPQELAHPAEMILLQQKEGQPETHTAQKSDGSPGTHTTQESSDSSEMDIAQKSSGVREIYAMQKNVDSSQIDDIAFPTDSISDEMRLAQKSASPFAQEVPQELAQSAEMVLLQQKEGQPETHTAQESSDSLKTHTAQNASGVPETHTMQKTASSSQTDDTAFSIDNASNEMRLAQKPASSFAQAAPQELAQPAEMVLLQQKEGQSETHMVQESRDSSKTHTAQKHVHPPTMLTSQHLAQKPAHPIQTFDTLSDMAYLPMQMVPPQAEKTDKPNGAMQNLPDWAKRFLQQQTPIKSANPMVWNAQTDASSTPSHHPQQQIQWQAPNALQQPTNIVYREQGQKQQQPVQQSPVMTDYELRRTADKVYHLIEDRLRREFRRSGR